MNEACTTRQPIRMSCQHLQQLLSALIPTQTLHFPLFPPFGGNSKCCCTITKMFPFSSGPGNTRQSTSQRDNDFLSCFSSSFKKPSSNQTPMAFPRIVRQPTIFFYHIQYITIPSCISPHDLQHPSSHCTAKASVRPLDFVKAPEHGHCQGEASAA